MAGDYPGSTFYGAHSANYSVADRPRSNRIDKIIIHVMQGSFSGTVQHFRSAVEASAHYSIRTSDGHVGQHVREKDIAYHAGYWPYNQTSIGIEHEGYVSDPSAFTPRLYDYSAQLTAHLCKKYGIPVDRQHIIGHNVVPGCSGGSGGGSRCHTDPGPYWDWDRFIGQVRYFAGGSGGAAAYSMVVDNGTPGRFSARGRIWDTSSYSSQRYGADYRFTRPRRRAYYASWKIAVPSRGAYDVYVRHPANSSYNSRALYRVRTVQGWVVRSVDQRSGGGRWKKLGRFTLAKGDAYWVRLSSKTSGNNGYIVADAVRIVRR